MLLDRGDEQGFVLKALREAGNSLVSQMYGVAEELLCRRPVEDEMCLKEIAAHLRDSEELALEQMTAIAERSLRPLPAWDVDLLPMEKDYRSEDLEVFLAEFRGLRRETTNFLWTVGEQVWHAAGQHPYRGEITIGQIAHELAQHDLEHLWQVRQLKHQLGAVTAGASEDDWW
jgi:DinB superfamily